MRSAAKPLKSGAEPALSVVKNNQDQYRLQSGDDFDHAVMHAVLQFLKVNGSFDVHHASCKWRIFGNIAVFSPSWGIGYISGSGVI